jgi:inositol transport system ATP-binding protein
MAEGIILRVLGVSKSFPGVIALDKVSLEIKKGEVHALVGENGAGKSTLMKILLGIYNLDEGEIEFKGKLVHIPSPRAALDLGLSMIHQELNLNPYRSIAENIWLGREPTVLRTFIIDWKRMHEKTRELLEEIGMQYNPKERVETLSVADKQMVEIARAISYRADLLVMDEPTSALSEKEVDELFALVRLLRNKGISIIFISHRLEEIFRIADRITVLRDGKNVGTVEARAAQKSDVVSMMVGREINNLFPKVVAAKKNVAIEVRNLTSKNHFSNISFTVREGEILGIAGLMGSGRTELIRAIFGLDSYDSGEIFVFGKKMHVRNPQLAILAGMGMIPEDRRKTGLIACRPLSENMSLASLDRFSSKWVLRRRREIEECKTYVKALSIKTRNLATAVEFMSGGNQQKAIIARWLMTKPKILLMDEPTRGIDVAAKSEVHKIISDLANEGKAIIMVSSEMPEILGMSDRIIAISGGEQSGEFTAGNATQEGLMACFLSKTNRK